MALTDLKIRTIKPNPNRNIKLSDGNGLYLYVLKRSKKWKFRYRVNKKNYEIPIGTYPNISLQEARIIIYKYIDLLEQTPPVNPLDLIKEEERKNISKNENTFEKWAEMWFDHWHTNKSEKHVKYTQNRLDRDIYPHFGEVPVSKVSINDIKNMMQICVDRNAIDMARKVFELTRMILQYAVEHQDKSFCVHNVAKDINFKANVPDVKRKNYRRLPLSKFPELLQRIDGYQGLEHTKIALQIAPHVFLRPSELMQGEWSEIDWDNGLWRIPKARMKLKTEHLVPLSTQVISLLKHLHTLTGNAFYLFPTTYGEGSKEKVCGKTGLKLCMTHTYLLKALDQIGYKYKMTAHGFRGMARTQLGELGYRREWMELQLSHLVGSASERAYNYAQHLAERRVMMQEWSDFLDEIKCKKT
jgi:integrase